MDEDGAFYREQAAQMLEQAERIADPSLRQSLQLKAASWLRMAEEAENAWPARHPLHCPLPSPPPQA